MSNQQKSFLIVFVLSLVIFAVCFKLYGLTFQSMWLDELLSINHSIPSDILCYQGTLKIIPDQVTFFYLSFP
jgi:hypothetical protein